MKHAFYIAVIAFLIVPAIFGCACGDDDDDRPEVDDDTADDDVLDDDLIGDDDVVDDDVVDDDVIDDDVVDDDLVDDDVIDDDVVDDDVIDDDVIDDDVIDDDIVDDDVIDDDIVDDDVVDDDTSPLISCYRDSDGDGYGDPEVMQDFPGFQCPLGWVEDNTDCDDTNPNTYQLLDGYPDRDLDGFGAGFSAQVCTGAELPYNYSETADDCKDSDPFINPDSCDFPDDGVDQDCSEGDFSRSDDNGIFVSPGGDDGNPGTMALPKLTLAEGIATAELDAKSVFVAAGTFNENVITGVSLYGGYESAAWTRDIVVHATTVVAQTSDPAISVDNETEYGGTVVEGFVVQGVGSGTYSRGLVVANYSTAIVAHNDINGGSGTTNAYGFISHGADVLLYENTIVGGSGTLNNIYVATFNGGADCLLYANRIEAGADGNDIYVVNVNQNAVVTMVNNELVGGAAVNTCQVVDTDGEVILVNNTLFGGDTGDTQNALVAGEGQVVLVHNYLHGGTNATDTRGLSLAGGATATLVNNIVNGGDAGDTSYGIYLNDATVTMMNNDIWGTAPSALVYIDGLGPLTTPEEINTCVWTGCTEAGDNISDDPKFVTPQNLHLSWDSPCINAGVDPNAWYAQSWMYFDIDFQVRPRGDGWDIGYDEYFVP